MSGPELAVGAVIVHYRTPAALRDCVDALVRQEPAPARILVVDTSAAEDGLTDAPVTDCEWLAAPGNVGFGAAANLGAASLREAAILVLNADLVLRPGALRALTSRLSGQPDAAIVAPRIYMADGELEHNARRFPGVSTGVLGRSSGLTALLRRLGRTPRQLADSTARQAASVDWVSGACMLVRHSDWEALCGFDEGYWMYWEDADLCRRALQLGRRTWIEPAAVADHATGSSGRSRRTVAAFHASAARYYERHLGRTHLDRVLVRAVLRVRGRVLSHRIGRRTAL